MPVSKVSAGMPFIISTGTSKTDPELRKFIRSHVMKGKNKGKYRNVKTAQRKSVTKPDTSNHNQDDQLSFQSYAIIPSKVGGDFSFTRFADSIDESMVVNILRFSSIAKKVLFPLENRINFGHKTTAWLEPMSNDALYLHSLVFSVQMYFDLSTGRQTCITGEGASLNFMKTLRYLRERLILGKEQTILSDPTITVIISLLFYAQVKGEFEMAKRHLAALQNVIRMRGGFDSFKHNSKLMIDILRADISMTLGYNSEPVFEPTPDSFIHFASITTLGSEHFNFSIFSPPSSISSDIPNDLEDELSTTWEVLQGFCTMVNHTNDKRIPPEIILQTMSLVMYKLLKMKFEPDSVDEAVRLGLLAFTSHIFLLWRSINIPYNWLVKTYEDCLCSLKNLEKVPLDMMIWLLMIGAIAVFNDYDEWLNPLLKMDLEMCEVKTWIELRGMLKSFLWIDILHDPIGNGIYSTIYK